MNKLSRAICFATEAFDGKYRKGEKCPAIFHSFEAAAIVQTVCDDEDVMCAAVLHDTVEDTIATLEQIEELFGERIAFLVSSETEMKYPSQNPTETWLLRKEQTLNILKESSDIGVKAMWLGDKLSNMRSFSRMYDTLGEDMWEFFHQKDPNEHKKYYQSIAAELEIFSETNAFQEFTALINKIFGE